ncbi:MAG: M56 family metallopeptidase [Allosphingosinicella sp.]|uniref:M56 family metallopeptidase n=1 Tax=Allosphingosinicella sp. TaxID=2823234 RepID=UPI003959E059
MTSWFFIEMAAKSALICGLALILAMALKDRAAADRARVLQIGIALLVALPVIDILFPVLRVEAFAAPEPLTPEQIDALVLLAAATPAGEASIWDDPAPLILLLWAAGAVGVGARLAVGLMTLRRWTRNGVPATDPVWIEALERAREACGAPASLRLLVADKVPGPLGWGLMRPVILIDADTYAEREEADAILAHEVAHVARRDWPALILARLATALFWFNPLSWALAREAVQQAEEAADAYAARVVEPTRYAETLLSWAQLDRGDGVPATSIAPGRHGLSRRVRAVLEERLRDRPAGTYFARMAMLLCIGVAAPVAALELVEAARPPAESSRPGSFAAVAQDSGAQAPAASGRPEAPAQARTPGAPQEPGAPETPEIPDIEAAIAPALRTLDEVLPRVPVIVARAMDSEHIAAAVAQAQAQGVRISHEELEARLAEARARMPDPERLRRRIEADIARHREVRVQVRHALADSRRHMARGAEGMERGAAQMEEQARRFRNRDERERIIARERERGHAVTHEELLEAAEGMEEGARGMREAAREMRRGVRDMAQDD